MKLDFGLGPENLSAEAREAWKGEFGLIYSVALTRGALRTSMLVRNDGGEAWEFQVLMHTYLRVKVGVSLVPLVFGEGEEVKLTYLGYHDDDG